MIVAVVAAILTCTEVIPAIYFKRFSITVEQVEHVIPSIDRIERFTVIFR